MNLQRGFTLWELLTVMALIVILILVAVENLLPLRGDAERARHSYTVGALRSAVGLEATRRALTDGASGIARMHGANPIVWLATPPARYAGAVAPDKYKEIPPGGWAFDVINGWLLYRIRYTEYVEPTSSSVIRYRVEVERDTHGLVSGVQLSQLDAVHWRTDGSTLRRWLKEVGQ